MKRILNVIFVISIIFSLTSCAVHSGLTSNMNNNTTNVVLQNNNYKIIERVQGEASGVWVLGIGGSFRPLVAKARRQMLAWVNLTGHAAANNRAVWRNVGIPRGTNICVISPPLARVENVLKAATAPSCRTLLAMPDSDSAR
ncbi:MAG: hypothetical protein FWE63_08940 [Bacteroidales bacterium]|nr:hypothetical protein [Bacteroidales bacterium]